MSQTETWSGLSHIISMNRTLGCFTNAAVVFPTCAVSWTVSWTWRPVDVPILPGHHPRRRIARMTPLNQIKPIQSVTCTVHDPFHIPCFPRLWTPRVVHSRIPRRTATRLLMLPDASLAGLFPRAVHTGKPITSLGRVAFDLLGSDADRSHPPDEHELQLQHVKLHPTKPQQTSAHVGNTICRCTRVRAQRQDIVSILCRGHQFPH